MDAGACGWSAQRMLPTGPAAVQRDYDGTPMPTDVMHDDTCRELAEVLAERNDGFVQMLLVSGDNARDQRLLRGAGHDQRPADAHERRAGLRSPAAHPPPRAGLAEELPRARHPRVRPGAHHRRRLHLHLRGLEPLRRLRGLVRGHDRHARGAAGQARRSGAPRGACATTCRSPRPARCRRSPSSGPSSRRTRSGSTTRWPMPARRWASTPVDAMLDIAVEEDLKTEFFAAPPNGKIELPEGDGRRSLRAVRRVRRRRPHQVPDRRPLSHRDAVQGGARAQDADAWRRRTGGCRRCRPRSPASAAAAC